VIRSKAGRTRKFAIRMLGVHYVTLLVSPVRPQGAAAVCQCCTVSGDLLLKHTRTAAYIAILAPLYFDRWDWKGIWHCSRPRWLVGLSPRTPGFDPRPVYVRFVVHKVALGQGFLRVLLSSTVKIISNMLHTYSFTDAISS